MAVIAERTRPPAAALNATLVADLDCPLFGRPRLTLAAAATAAATMLLIYPSGGKGVVAALVAAVVVACAATDVQHRLIPNNLVVPGTVVVGVVAVLTHAAGLETVALAAVAGFAFFAIPNLISGRLAGMGDAKLAMFLGAGLGWGTFSALFVGFAVMLPFAIVAIVRRKPGTPQKGLPAGAFIAFGTLVVLVARALVIHG